MKKKIVWILVTILVVAAFVGISALYKHLSGAYIPDSLVKPPEHGADDTVLPDTGDPEDDGESSEKSEFAAPDVTLYDVDGGEIKLSDYFGKPIVLNFWASWCPPCKQEMPHFEAAYKDNEDVTFLMVNVTTSDRETFENAKEHIETNGYTFPVLYDLTGEAASTYGTYSLPLTFFIDKNGDLVTYAMGMLTAEQLDVGIGMITDTIDKDE